MTRAGHVAHRVYDPVLRLLHGVNALLIVLLGVGGVAADSLSPGATRAWLHDTHGILGAALIVGLLGRLVWGWVGPAHARWRDLWHPADWRTELARGRLFTPPRRPGHHPVASLVYLAVYALLGVLAASGLCLLASTQGTGPLAAVCAWDARLTAWLAEPHRLAGWAVLCFVCAHLAALVLHARLHRVPVAQSMWSGVQYLEPK
ncbi:MAG: cytochrome b/b6 domain-containing protein [Thiobacillus sp.]|nr:cytochrome b/b6 domain-containing protein [Thiobacillus sp.]